MSKLKVLVVVVVGLALMALPLFAACAPAAPPEEEAPTPPEKEEKVPTAPKEKVKLVWLHNMGLTGPYAGYMKWATMASEALVKWVNETNYIPGAELEMLIYDDEADAAKAVSAFRRGMGHDPAPVLFTTESTTGNLACKPLIDREKIIPVIGGGPNPKVQTPGSWMFVENPRYEGDTCAFIDFCEETGLVDEPPMSGTPKFAFVTWDNPFGRCFVNDASIAYMKEKGWKYMGAVYIPMATTDTSAQAIQLKKWGVNVTFGGIYPEDQVVIVKDCDRMGLTGKIVWGNPTTNAPMMTNVLSGGLFEGAYTCQFCPIEADEFEPEILKAWEAAKAEPAGKLFFGTYWSHARVCAEVIRVAAEMVGPENVTGKDVYNAIRRIDDFYGTWTCPVNFTEDHIGIHNVKMYQCVGKGLDMVRVSDKLWFTPNLW